MNQKRDYPNLFYFYEHQVFVYPKAEHGFFCDRRGSYHPESAQSSWQEVIKLFKKL